MQPVVGECCLIHLHGFFGLLIPVLDAAAVVRLDRTRAGHVLATLSLASAAKHELDNSFLLTRRCRMMQVPCLVLEKGVGEESGSGLHINSAAKDGLRVS